MFSINRIKDRTIAIDYFSDWDRSEHIAIAQHAVGPYASSYTTRYKHIEQIDNKSENRKVINDEVLIYPKRAWDLG